MHGDAAHGNAEPLPELAPLPCALPCSSPYLGTAALVARLLRWCRRRRRRHLQVESVPPADPALPRRDVLLHRQPLQLQQEGGQQHRGERRRRAFPSLPASPLPACLHSGAGLETPQSRAVPWGPPHQGAEEGGGADVWLALLGAVPPRPPALLVGRLVHKANVLLLVHLQGGRAGRRGGSRTGRLAVVTPGEAGGRWLRHTGQGGKSGGGPGSCSGPRTGDLTRRSSNWAKLMEVLMADTKLRNWASAGGEGRIGGAPDQSNTHSSAAQASPLLPHPPLRASQMRRYISFASPSGM